MGQRKEWAVGLIKGFSAAGLLGVAALAAATPQILSAPTEAVVAEPELIEQIVIYRRALTVQDVKPSFGVPRPHAEDSDDNPVPADPAPSAITRYSTPLRLALPFPMTEAQAQAWAAQQMSPAEIEGVLVDRVVKPQGVVSSNDSLAYTLWNLAAGSTGTTQSEPVWPNHRGNGITVAVLDTGKVDHPDMQGVWTGGYDFLGNTDLSGDGDGRDADPTDTMNCIKDGTPQVGTPHGLHVASIIAARLNNNEGLVGVAPEASIMPVRVISGCGGVLSDVLDAMRWAVGLPVSGVPTNPNPVKILNLSLGTTSPGATCDTVTQGVIDQVLATGATIVVSTGNNGQDAITVPAACNGVIAVAATTKDGKRADYSNAGTGTTLAAAGGGCPVGAPANCNTDPYNFVAIAHHDGTSTGYRMGSGTSYAAPHVAGAVALLLAQDGTRSPSTIQGLLTASARPIAAGTCDGGLCGAGMLDVEAALVPPPFTVSASAQTANVRAGDAVVLEGDASSSAISPTFVWQQLTGPSVSLTLENDGRTARFIAPDVNGILSFRLTATDNTLASRSVDTNVTVTIAPVLAPVDPIHVEIGSSVRKAMKLADGGTPQAIAVDSSSVAQGVKIEGVEVVWNQPPEGDHQVEVTPYDSVGSGVPISVQVMVDRQDTASTTADATQNPMGGGGGLVGWHGAILLLLAGALLIPNRGGLGVMLPSAPRTVAHERALRSSTELATTVGVLAIAAMAIGIQAPTLAFDARSLPIFAWLASFSHIDAAHLVSNLLGLAMLQIVFARAIDARAWAAALLVAAPAAHFLAVGLGLHTWVAGLSTALHALAAWAIGIYWVDDRIRGRGFGPVLAVGLVIKLLLDALLQVQWPQAGAVASVALHASAAVIGLVGGVLIGHRRVAGSMAAVTTQ
ncbi:MAG: S8 family serine peptidase [Burkholderiaceae bacterium]